MKIKYLRLTKDQRKKARNLYYATPKGKALKSKLRMVIISIIGLVLCAVIFLIEAILTNGSAWDYAYSICLGVFALIFLIAYIHLRLQRINNYVVSNKLKL